MRNWHGSGTDGESLMTMSTSGDGDVGSDAGDAEMEDISSDPMAIEGGSSSDVADSEDGSSEFALTVESLNCAAMLDVSVEFEKWSGSSVFSLATVTIEVAPSEESGCPLQEMVGDNAVVMTLEIKLGCKKFEVSALHVLIAKQTDPNGTWFLPPRQTSGHRVRHPGSNAVRSTHPVPHPLSNQHASSMFDSPTTRDSGLLIVKLGVTHLITQRSATSGDRDKSTSLPKQLSPRCVQG